MLPFVAKGGVAAAFCKASPWLLALSALIAAWLVARTAHAGAPSPQGRTVVTYWDKWTDFEKAAMQAVVDDFNASQQEIYVDFLSISGISQKTLIAIAGGNPPDIAGVWANDVIDFADKNALIPLDEMARGTLVDRERYLPIYWDMGVYRGKLYGVPSTPGVTGLHWNKALFRAAGLDPERPPRTLAELDAYADKLTIARDGKIEQIGFLHSEPPWWPFFWVHFFHGELWDGRANVTLDEPRNVRAFEWIQSYARRYGVGPLQNLSAGFGNFASAQNPFMSGKLAMVFQGVWLANYIEQYAPELEWSAAPMPVLNAGEDPVVFVDTDMLLIPRGAPHPEAAFRFIEFVASQASTEKLNLGQRKNSPLREVSAHFYATHEHPHIVMFQELAESKNARGMPKMSIWREYRSEVADAFQRVWLLESTPREALAKAEARIQKSWDRERRRQAARPSAALAWAPIALIALFVAALVALALRERVRHRVAMGGRKSARAHVSGAKGLAFFSPWAVGLLVFIGYPVAASLVHSFCDYSVLQEPRWVGLQNFAELFGDQLFFVALRNTLLYVAFALPLGLLIAFAAALALDSGLRGSGIYRTLVFLPSLTPVVASAMVWLWIYNAEYGVLNDLLRRLSFGLIDPVPWLADRHLALPSIILMSCWSVGQMVVILLAALQDVPTSVYEAADIDGASFWHKVRHITLPLVSPVLYFNAIMGIIAGLQIFAQPYIMTGGGPARATLTYTMQLYENAFTFLRMGYASAMAWIMFVVILLLTAAAVRVGRHRVHYSGA
jgi:ABC-type sugar transport system permease subunit/ABC-type glycerol-3-phosphate transport system substrate-binding protein